MDTSSVSNNTVCPVCTLYLRPGMTLRSHLSSHPKQKVIEALVRLAATEDLPKIEAGPSSSTSLATTVLQQQQQQQHGGGSSSEQVVTSAANLNQTVVNQNGWSQQHHSHPGTASLVNMPPALPSPLHHPAVPSPAAAIQGNHVFIYQQSLSSTAAARTTPSAVQHAQHPQQNVLNVNHPMSAQQYLVPTVLNHHHHPAAQMMPYIYQQQQLIMSSGACLSTAAPVPAAVPHLRAAVGPQLSFEVAGAQQGGDNNLSLSPQIIPVTSNSNNSSAGGFQQQVQTTRADKNLVVVEQGNDGSSLTVVDPRQLSPGQQNPSAPSSCDVEIVEAAPKTESCCVKTDDVKLSTADNDTNNRIDSSCDDADQSLSNPEHSPGSPTGSDWNLRIRSDLNKACQTTQQTCHQSMMSPARSPALLQDGLVVVEECPGNFDKPGTIEVLEHHPDEPEYYFVGSAANTQQQYIASQNFDQPPPIYSIANILQPEDHLDFVDMDGMHMVTDFSANQIISQVENFEGSTPDRPGVLMTIGGMVDTNSNSNNNKQEEEDDDEEDLEETEENHDNILIHRGEDSRESMSITNVNIRADERMPPRGELSGQESLGSDVTSWSHHHLHQQQQQQHRYNDSNHTSIMSNSYDLLQARESWEACAPGHSNSSCSDAEAPPLQSRLIPTYSSLSRQDEDGDCDNDSPTIVSVTGPPLNFKCSTCGEAFKCVTERKQHEAVKHPEKNRGQSTTTTSEVGRSTSKIIGSQIAGKRKVKKLVVKIKSVAGGKKNLNSTTSTTVGNALVESSFDFTNKLKLETLTTTKSEPADDLLQCPNNNAAALDPNIESADVKTEDHLLLPPDDNDDQPPASANLALDLKTVCQICDMVLVNSKALKEHKAQIHQLYARKRHKCTTCEAVFPTDYKFSEHLKIHPLECKMCGKLFYRRQNMQLHMRRHLGIRPYNCDVCEKSFLTKQKRDEHRNIHTGEQPIKCSLCDETFRRHSNLVQHRNRHHLNVKRKVKDYICACKEIFHSKKKLAWHKEIHDAKPKACTQCSERFIHMSSLTRHMRRAHNGSFLPKGHKFAENVECPICKGVFLKSSLEVHIRNHSGQRPWTCPICNKDFTTKWNLKLHKWTHQSRFSKPFKCDQCRGAFVRHTDYVAHMNSHKNIRPYTCNHCGAQFIRKYNCQRHVKEHENDKLFNCKVCGKKFHRSYYLKDHMRIHSGLRPFSCHICGKTSTTKSNHNKHVQIHHAREPVSTEN